MQSVLAVIRWILHKLSIILLGTTIWLFIPLLALSVNVTDSNQVKLWLVESNTYETFSSESLSFIDVEEEKSLADEASFGLIDESALVDAIKNALPSEYLQAQAETVIDGFYGWLEGDTLGPEFNVSLESQKPEIEKALKAELQKQIQAFPPCTIEQAVQPGFDPFESECLPPGTDVNAQVDTIVAQFFADEDSIFNQEFTGEDLNMDKQVKLNGPFFFDTVELLPIFYWAFLFAFGALTIITARHWKRGFKEVGATILGATILLTIFSLLSSRLSDAPGRYLSNISELGSGAEDEASRAIVEPLVEVITADVASTSLFFTLITLAIGAVAYLIGWKLSPRQPKPAEEQDEVPELLKENDDENNIIDRVEAETKKEKKSSRLKSKLKKTKKRLIQ